MQPNQIKISGNFKKRTIQAVVSIIFFILVYLILIALSVGLTILCGWAGLTLIFVKANFFTLIVGSGLISTGIMILIFLLKFLFKENKIDRSHLIEITEHGEPALFEFIREIVKETGTNFPKRIYLTSEVNASVFYDSSFWSMFFPVKKNLQIGLGLINTVSKNEFKAILAHEFGHFSQRSMKLGSYVYNVNQIIFNMLYDNESYDELAQKWANIHWGFALFVRLAIQIVRGIQSLLKYVYDIVNISYLGLSREMEFHADAVAANVTGSKPLIDSLLRMDLSDSSFNLVLNFYDRKIADAKKTKDIYSQQRFVLNYLAHEQELPVENNLPLVTLDYLSRFNRSKLNITNQWASHPSTEDRVREIRKLNILKDNNDPSMATDLFMDIDNLQTRVTEHLFSRINYEKPPVDIDQQEFITELTYDFKSNSFGKLFNHYFDNKNPSKIELENLNPAPVNFDELFSNKAVDMVFTSGALESDIHALKQIISDNRKIKSVDYDGRKYNRKDIRNLIPELEKESETLTGLIKENDNKILGYFNFLAKKHGQLSEFTNRYRNFLTVDNEFLKKQEILVRMVNSTNFMSQVTPFETIEENLTDMEELEADFKNHIQSMLKSDIYQPELNTVIRQNLVQYTSGEHIYYDKREYDNDALNILFTAMNNYQFLTDKTYFNVKKNLLDHFEYLQSSETNSR